METKHTTKADLEAALKAILVQPRAYWSRGPDYVIEEMTRIAEKALKGDWAGVAASAKAEGRS